MDINTFVTEHNKLDVPINEIDNIYIWTRISKTQEALLPAESYYKLAKTTFEVDTKKVVQVLKQKLPSVKPETYRFSDYITFTVNKSKIFNDKTCFVYMTNLQLLNSLACYLAHTMNKYLPEDDSLASLIINKIDEPEKFTKLMDSDFIILRVHGALPDHKYRSTILDTVLLRRSRQGYCTLVYTPNTNLLISPDLIPKERAEDKLFVDLSPLWSIFDQRRKSDYRALMKDWLSIMKYTPDTFVYSKKKPEEKIRIIDRYKQ